MDKTHSGQITITLRQIREAGPCADGWAKALKAHGPDMDRAIPLSAIIDSNGVADALWRLRYLPQHAALWRMYAVWCARRVSHLVTDDRCIAALDVAERHAMGLATDSQLKAARMAAYAAAYAASEASEAADVAARMAAYAAADVVADVAAYAAARMAAYAAADAAAEAAYEGERSAQEAKLRQTLDVGAWISD